MSTKNGRAKHRRQARQHAHGVDLVVAGGRMEHAPYTLSAKSPAGIAFLDVQTGGAVSVDHPAQIVALVQVARRLGLFVAVD